MRIANGRMRRGQLRTGSLCRYNQTEAAGANCVVSSRQSRVHGGAHTLSNGVNKLSSNFWILAIALARAAGASSNTSRVKVTGGIFV